MSVDYPEQFEQDKSIIKSQLGENVLDTFMESYPKYTLLSTVQQDAMKKEVFKVWMATMFLRGCNQSIYGELMRDYRKDYANNDDNYPKSVRGMVDVMRQLKPKAKSNKSSNKEKNQNRSGTQQNQIGNKVEPKKESIFATAAACWCCGIPGCIS